MSTNFSKITSKSTKIHFKSVLDFFESFDNLVTTYFYIQTMFSEIHMKMSQRFFQKEFQNFPHFISIVNPGN